MPVGILAIMLFKLGKYDTFVACLALIISVSGLFLSQKNIQTTIEEQTRHNIVSQRPLLQTNLSWDVTKVSLSVKNGGIGLAKIISFIILDHGEETSYKNLLQLIDNILEEKDYPIQKDSLFGSTLDSEVLLPGEKSVLLEINYPYQWHLENMLDLTSELKSYSMMIEYIDVYDLDAFKKGGKESVQRLFVLEAPILEPSPDMLPVDETDQIPS